MTLGMSVSGRSAMPTESPSSIQNPMPISPTRSSSESAARSASPRGTANRVVATPRTFTPSAGRDA